MYKIILFSSILLFSILITAEIYSIVLSAAGKIEAPEITTVK